MSSISETLMTTAAAGKLVSDLSQGGTKGDGRSEIPVEGVKGGDGNASTD